MAAVPGFRHDIFLSYAHSDNHPVAGTESGFVSELITDLKTEIGRKLGSDVDIWWDHYKLTGGMRVTPEIMAAAGDCASIIVVASPAYLRSEWCERERTAFIQRIANSQSGVFLVAMESIEQSGLPAALRDLIPYPFYRTLDDGRTTRPLRTEFQQDKEPYYNRLSQLVHHITEHLVAVRSKARQPADTPRVEVDSDGKPAVLLLEVTDELLERRAQLKDYLEQEGVVVLPAKRYSRDDMDRHREQMLQDLERSRVCVQMLGPLTGDRSDDARGMPWFRCNAIRSAGSKVPFVQWRDPDLDTAAIADDDARELIMQPGVRTDRFPDFRRSISELACRAPERVDPRLQQNVLSVFVNSDLLDRELAAGVAQWLESKGFIVLEPPRVTEDAREEWEASVKYCDSLLLVYGSTKPAWVRTQVLLSNKVKRETPLDLLSVCVGPPVPASSREKLDALALRYPGIYYLEVPDTSNFNAAEMDKFVTRLREAHAHA